MKNSITHNGCKLCTFFFYRFHSRPTHCTLSEDMVRLCRSYHRIQNSAFVFFFHRSEWSYHLRGFICRNVNIHFSSCGGVFLFEETFQIIPRISFTTSICIISCTSFSFVVNNQTFTVLDKKN